MAFVQAIEGFYDVSSGTEVFVAADEIIDDSNPIVKAHPDLFRPMASRFEASAPAPKTRAANK